MGAGNRARTIFIRADMNAEIATGHIMRCLSVADAVRELGGEAVFLTADEEPRGLVGSRGYECRVLGSDWRRMDGELGILREVLGGGEAAGAGLGAKESLTAKGGETEPTVLVDSYAVTEGYLRSLSEMARVVYLDDLGAIPHPVDVVVNYEIYADEAFYEGKRAAKRYLLGPDAAPLRGEFQGLPPKSIAPEARTLLLMGGGGDAGEALAAILERIPAGRYEGIDVLCGRFGDLAEALRKRFEGRSEIRIHEFAEDVLSFYQTADIAISAAGSTLYELCAAGTPTVCYCLADNQIRNALGFAERSLMEYAGDVRADPVPARAAEALERYGDAGFRAARSRRMQELIDGQGAKRIAQILLD